MSRAYRPAPPCERLWDLYDYKPLTGELISRQTGRPVGRPNAKGYLYATLAGNANWAVHRAVWVWVTGKDPAEMQVDHKDCNRSNNRWGNLRLATNLENCFNRLARQRHGRHPSSYKGVNIVEGKYIYAVIQVNGKRVSLGRYETEAEAHAAYRGAAIVRDSEFWRAS